MYDLIIKNGKVVDFSNSVNEGRTIYIRDGVFVESLGNSPEDAKRVIDARGCYVTPGFIDSHLHVYDGAGSSVLNAPADIVCIPNCVTTCVDGGSAGPLNFEGFYKSNIAYSKTTIKAALHMHFNGIMPNGYDEDEDPKGFDLYKIKKLVQKYGGNTIVGLKIRQHAASAGKYGVRPLAATIELAKEIKEELGINLRAIVHVTDIAPDIHMRDIVNLLRKGDVFTHTYSGMGRNILDANGCVIDEVLEAQKRGVYFDSGFATSRLDIKVVEAAFKEGLYPDLIGTDTVGFNMYLKPMFSLPYQMGLLLAMGMPIEKILRAVTINPAENFGITREAGTLSPGAKADVAIFKLASKRENYTDLKGQCVEGSKIFVPMCTIKDGAVVYMQIFM